MSVLVRFAPSPTGRLHVGNARTALVNWLFARNKGGRFLLRFDDTDIERSSDSSAKGIEDDLRWLGLDWDETFHQSARLDFYSAAAERLKASGRLYACYETPDELALKRKHASVHHLPPIYDRAALELTDADRNRLEAEGRKPHWRFLLERRPVAWTDHVCGEMSIDAGNVSDPVLIRQDGVALYSLSSVVDDADRRVSHVIRGEDHLTNTVVQMQLFEALGCNPPAFAHLALLVGAKGEGLSKRLGSLGLGDIRQQGIEAMALASLLARLGTSKPIEPVAAMGDLVSHFDLGDFGRAPARFDLVDLHGLNAKLLHHLPYGAVAGRLPDRADEAFWFAVRGNLATLAEATDWWQVVAGEIQPVLENPDLLAQSLQLLPEGVLDQGSWQAWTKAVGQATGLKGRALFRPLRLALTAREHGPEMHNLLPLIGRERAMMRLEGKTA
jgi:glutamyl-tRNA synthetase